MVKIEGGYFIKARRVQQSKVMHFAPAVREIWDYLIMSAMFKDGKNGIKRGQCLMTYDEILEALHWFVGFRKMRYTKHQCEGAMKVLVKEHMITTQKTTRGMLITVVNYDIYQDFNSYEAGNEAGNKATRSGQGADTIEKEGERNVNKREYTSGVIDLAEGWFKYIKKEYKSSTIKLDQQYDAIESLINLGHPIDKIRRVLRFVATEDFYKKNIRSVKKLTKNWENRQMRWIDAIIEDMNKAVQPTKCGPPVAKYRWEFYEGEDGLSKSRKVPV
jgi:hypothetical protein